jgi:hypothetical protein
VVSTLTINYVVFGVVNVDVTVGHLNDLPYIHIFSTVRSIQRNGKYTYSPNFLDTKTWHGQVADGVESATRKDCFGYTEIGLRNRGRLTGGSPPVWEQELGSKTARHISKGRVHPRRGHEGPEGE